MSAIEARSVAQSYITKLVSETQTKVKAKEQKELTLKEHEELLRYQQLCEEQRQLIEALKKQLEDKSEEASELRLQL
jgi:hypothetical protein